MRVPDVPDPLPDPRVHTWPAGDPIVRCHHISMGATEFNTSNVSRRFRPVTRGGDIVSTLYAADLPQGALSETVFHDVPVRGKGRRIQRRALVPMVRSTIIPNRPLQLVELHGAGLRRLRVTHGELIESSSRQYPRTAAWGQALYNRADFDGLIWRSRQFNDSFALMLWGDRVDRFADLEADPDIAPLPLYAGAGFDEVQQLADDCGITVVG
jgi:RES domain